ncbi:hypothetical protein HNY73_001983 [Argiope bruennichi]|uniref:Uncharacterized protein n=1 Tax=Argiope bruennichi TaxID=94029 RepID=A0A8T0FS08_ARGBR|nr:hypothetical protein HNY73_001983 [Argiope bruennichi]
MTSNRKVIQNRKERKNILGSSSFERHVMSENNTMLLMAKIKINQEFIWSRLLFVFTDLLCNNLPQPPLKMLSATQVFAAVALLGMLAYAAADPNVFDDIETGLNHIIGHDKSHN